MRVLYCKFTWSSGYDLLIQYQGKWWDQASHHAQCMVASASLTYYTTLIPHVLHYPHPSHTTLPSSLTYYTTLIPHVLHYPHPSRTTLPLYTHSYQTSLGSQPFLLPFMKIIQTVSNYSSQRYSIMNIFIQSWMFHSPSHHAAHTNISLAPTPSCFVVVSFSDPPFAVLKGGSGDKTSFVGEGMVRDWGVL